MMRTAERRGPGLTFAALAVAVAVVAALLPTLAAPAHADTGVEAAFVSRVNQERAAQGLPALTLAADLTTVARAHSEVMATAVDLHHQPDLGGSVDGWRKVGENVGRGPSVEAIHRAFMASPGHARNVMDPDWTQIGVGVVVRDGLIWVTKLFRLPSGSRPPAPVAPAPTTEPATPDHSTHPSASAERPPTDTAERPPTDTAERPVPADASPQRPIPPEDPAFDRLTVTLARVEAAEQGRSLHELLAGG